jgi:hypothetical protein
MNEERAWAGSSTIGQLGMWALKKRAGHSFIVINDYR